MYYCDHTQLNLPVHPGDDVFFLDDHSGYQFHTEKVRTVCISEGKLAVITELDVQPSEVENNFFLSYEDMVRWAQENVTIPPFTIHQDTIKWMDYSLWLPSSSGECYVRIANEKGYEVRKAYYQRQKDRDDLVPGFYESSAPRAKLIKNVAFWMDTYCSIEEAEIAELYEPPFDLFSRF